MKIKASELKDIALEYAVAVALGGTHFCYDTVATYWIVVDGKDRALSKGWAQSFTPSTNWVHGGPIIEREEIDTYCYESPKSGCGWWIAEITGTKAKGRGNTPLIAAMRCFVASRLGDEVEIPGELT